MSSRSELRKQWSRTWMRMRSEFVASRVPSAVILDGSTPGTVRWECPVCAAVGSDVHHSGWAVRAGTCHMQVHLSPEDSSYLEDVKVLAMPVELLTPYQRRHRDRLAGPPTPPPPQDRLL